MVMTANSDWHSLVVSRLQVEQAVPSTIRSSHDKNMSLLWPHLDEAQRALVKEAAGGDEAAALLCPRTRVVKHILDKDERNGHHLIRAALGALLIHQIELEERREARIADPFLDDYPS